MKTSAKGIAMIKKFESCRLKAYTDVGGVWTIGYGATGPDIQQGSVWTQEQCDERFVRDLVKFEDGVNDLVRVVLTQGQYDSLIDFSYNCGLGNLEKSTLLRKVNISDFEGAAKQFGRWALVNGKLVPALVKRRAAEKALFLEAVA